MRIAARVLAVAMLAVPAAAAVALAQSAPSRVVKAPDPRGDVRSPLDLTRVQLSRASDGRLRASITLASTWGAKDLIATSGPPGSVCLKVWTTSPPPDTPPDDLVCVTADTDGKLRGSVLRERPNRLPERVASALVTRASPRTVTLRFSQSSIGRPDTVRVAAESTRAGCTRVSCIDTAPDAPNILELKLRDAG
jgi:hypothetical protein